MRSGASPIFCSAVNLGGVAEPDDAVGADAGGAGRAASAAPRDSCAICAATSLSKQAKRSLSSVSLVQDSIAAVEAATVTAGPNKKRLASARFLGIRGVNLSLCSPGHLRDAL